MGWENFHSIWDEPEEDDKKKSSGPRPKKESSWWDHRESELSRGDESTESTGQYSYRGAFDDSDSAWYRQSSFRYSSFSDYSPSSLFRSSFSFRGATYSADNDVKNRAIRALRTLTRNANTVADATAKITYDVQFSAGADSNGVSDDISDKKVQTIYVSPDTVVKATEADDEDAAIDALTGFVLLRVQIAQEVAGEIIRDINKTSVRAMPMGLAEVIKLAPPAEEMARISAEFVDAYSAGVLAKSMLTRLSRRAVVEDWGGFAPYFVRHAKKFAGTKENLEKAELSTESLAAKIAYNMIADEEGIEVDKEVSDIAEKHLGEKLAHDQILPACIALMADLRAYVVSKSPKPPEDSLESILAAGLQEIVEEQKEASAASAAEESALRENLEGLADLLDNLYQSDEERFEARKFAEAGAQLAVEINQLKYQEKLLAAVKSAKKALETAAEKYNEAPAAHAVGMMQARRTLEQNLLHFGAQLVDWRNKGANQTITGPEYNTTPPQTGAIAQVADMEKLIEEVKPLVKQMRESLREKANALGEEFKAKLPEWEKRVTASLDMSKTVASNFEEAAKKYPSASTPSAVAASAAAQIDSKLQQLSRGAAEIDKQFSSITTSSNIGSAVQYLQALANSHIGDMRAVMDNFGWHHHHTPVGQFTAAATAAQNRAAAMAKANPSAPIDLKSWHEPAIDEFLGSQMLSKANFKANAMSEANSDLFEQLRNILRNDCGEIPRDNDGLDDSKQDKLAGAASSLGMSEQELLSMLRAVERDSEAGRDTSDAKALGQMLQDKLIEKAKELNPVDEQLFGETVEKQTTVLDGSALTHVNDEAKNNVEEEYVAYLSHNDAKPKLIVKTARPNDVSRGRVIATRIVQKCRGAIARIREALQFQNNKRTGEVHGLQSGDLDEGSLHKLRYDSEHIWSQKTITRMPDVAVGILVDQSGSMSSAGKIDQAREMCILLAEAVKRIPGVHLHIYGHTANMHGGMADGDLTLFEHYSSSASAENADLGSLGNIVAHCNNYDGYAIKETAKLLDKDPAKRKYLFVISDGLPHGAGYSGSDAKKHVASVCSFVRTRLKIPTYVFAVGAGHGMKAEFVEQYGKNNVMFLTQVSQCLPQITRFLRSALQKEKSLVDVSSD
jgi:hypothetical protein